MNFFTKKVMYVCDEPDKSEQTIIRRMKKVFGDFKYLVEFPNADVVNDIDAELVLKIKTDNPHGLKGKDDIRDKLHEVYKSLNPLFKKEGLRLEIFLYSSHKAMDGI